MKKVFLATAFIAISATAQADMINPVNQAKVDEMWSVYMPIVKLGEACGNRTETIKLTEKLLNYAYSNYVSTSIDKQFINLSYQTAEVELPIKMEVAFVQIKNNLTNPKVVKICSESKKDLLSMINKWDQKGY